MSKSNELRFPTVLYQPRNQAGGRNTAALNDLQSPPKGNDMRNQTVLFVMNEATTDDEARQIAAHAAGLNIHQLKLVGSTGTVETVLF